MLPESESNPQKKPQTKAVALAFDPAKDSLPRVTATGKGEIAELILRMAFDHNVKVRKDATLTEMLGLVDIEKEIPLAAMVAVAEILSYVYRENDKMKQLRDLKNERPS